MKVIIEKDVNIPDLIDFQEITDLIDDQIGDNLGIDKALHEEYYDNSFFHDQLKEEVIKYVMEHLNDKED